MLCTDVLATSMPVDMKEEDMPDKVRIAVVGGGRTGAPLIQEFINRPFVELVGVADVNPASPGATIAHEHGVPYTADYTEFAAEDANIDIIVEVSGDPKVKRTLKEAFVAQGNRETLILHDIVARLIMSMVENSKELVPSLHPEDLGIG